MGKQWKLWQTLFWGASKITADGDCSHEVKRHLFLGRKVMTNVDSLLKSRDITLQTKVHLVKAMVFPVVMCGCVQFSRLVVSDSLQPHGLEHARPPCPSPTPRIYPNSCPLSWWCHPTISSSVVPFSSCPQSFLASASFQMSQLFAWGGQSIGVSASISVLPVNTQDWSPLGWTGWISLQSKGLSRIFSNTTVPKHQFLGTFFMVQLSHPYMTTGKTIALTRQTFVGKVMSLLFNMLSSLVITFPKD